MIHRSVVVVGAAAITSADPAVRALGLPLASPMQGRGTESLDRESLLFASAGLTAAEGGRARSAEEIGVVCGTCSSGRESYRAVLRSIDGNGSFKPSSGPRSSFNAPAAELSMRAGTRGPTLTVTSGEAAGLEAVLLARHLIRDRQATSVLAGGVDVADEAGERREGAAALALAAAAPSDALLPRIEGGAAVFTTEEGARPLQEISSSAMWQALREAGRDPGEVELVVTVAAPHGGAREGRDASLRAATGVVAPTVVLDDLPSAIGGAAGALAALAAVVAVSRGARCAVANAVESDGRAFALVVGRFKGGSA